MTKFYFLNILIYAFLQTIKMTNMIIELYDLVTFKV